MLGIPVLTMPTLKQTELPGSEEQFNLYSERGIDPERVIREAEAKRQAEQDARDYEERHQKTFLVMES